MTRLGLVCAVGALCGAAPAYAASPFDGTWKVELHSAKLDPKPTVLLVKGGTYTCSSCTPRTSVPADGRTHPIAGHDYSDAMAVKTVDAHSILTTYFKGGKQVAATTLTISADNRTMTEKFTSTNTATGASTSGVGTATRIGQPTAGAHVVSGSWHENPLSTLSENGTMLMLKDEGSSLVLRTPDGVGYTAKFGGPPVMQSGDVAKTMISVARAGPDTIIETDRRGGKVVDVITMTVAANGKTMTYTDANKKSGQTNSFTAVKQ